VGQKTLQKEINEICQLNQLVEESKGVEEISQIIVKTLDSIKQKMFYLKLKEKRVDDGTTVFSSSLKLPAELPSVEESLKKLSAALATLETPGLEQSEVLRLRGIIAGNRLFTKRLQKNDP
jgi:hypothetical protein